MTSNVYSNAFNFASYQDGRVDLRTGQYSRVIQLATIRPQGATEASRTIALTFSMLKTDSDGYGIGWRLSNSQFDPGTSVLTLSSGASYTAYRLPESGPLSFRDLKLDNLKVVRSDTATITLFHIDGTMETLKRPTPSQPYRTFSLVFENGETFEYRYATNGTLTGIRSVALARDVLTLTYAFGVVDKVRTLVQGGRVAEVAFLSSNQLITAVTVPYDDTDGTATPAGQARFVYTYKKLSQGYYCISKITTPMGGSESINYTEQGLAYQNQTYLPVVNRLERYPGAGQPNLVTLYKYSRTQNFTGYPFPQGFQTGIDNLYKVSGSYEYWGEQTIIDPDAADTVLERVKSTFNKFHLVAREETQRGVCSIIQDYTYNAQAGVPFSDQPANLQIPRTVTATFANAETGQSRSETVTVESDAYGNVVSKTEASGIRSTYDYYPISGAGELCPAEPNGFFVRYCRLERIFPVNGDGGEKRTEMTYGQLQKTQGTGYFVLEKSRISNSGVASTSRYMDAPAQPMIHGRLAANDVEIGGAQTATDFAYRQVGLDLEETRVTIGHDGTRTSAGRTFCTLTQLLTQAQKAGPKVALTYDVMGRPLTETVAPGTTNAAAVTYAYHFADGSTPARLEQTDAKGMRYTTRYDGLARSVSVAQVMGGAAERAIKALRYDRLGNKTSETVFDQIQGRELEQVSRYVYGGWGELDHVIRPDGSVVLSVRDLVAHTMTTGVRGLSTTVNRYNRFNQVAEVTRVSADGVRLKTLERTYDGFGRCISLINADRHKTHYTYDPLDRIKETRMEPADATPARTVVTDYATFSSAELPTRVQVNGTVLGQRGYDGLGRMTSSANGSAAPTTYIYDGETMQPSASRSPRDVQLNYLYNSALGALSEITTSGGEACRFAHDPVTGRILDAQNGTATNQTSYDDYEAPCLERVRTAGEDWQTTSTSSPEGRLLQFSDAQGKATHPQYDAVGRLDRILGDGFAQDITYDSFGRVDSVTFTHGGIALETKLSYDSFDREKSRSLRLKGRCLETVTRSYTAAGLLEERETTDGEGLRISLERFGYDAYYRLTSFACEGTRHPLDNLGRGVKSQLFAYDAYDNVTRVESHYADGTTNISTRRFSTAVPTQLFEIRDTNPAQVRQLRYDANGNLIGDHQGRTYTYDDFDRLRTSSGGGTYGYDAAGRLSTQTPAGAAPLHFLYAQDRLIGQKQGGTSVALHFDGTAFRGRTVREDGGVHREANGVDLAGSVIARTDEAGTTTKIMYTPYGESLAAAGARPDNLAAHPCIAFNGQHLDALAHLYHLGNGRRAYCPDLMIFLSPDPLSPFGAGGFNAYGYCGGDPINMIDPTGLISKGVSLGLSILGILLAIAVFVIAVVAAVPTAGASLSLFAVVGAIGAGLGVVSATLGVASASIDFVDEQNGWNRSDISNKLNIASVAFGVASLVVGAGAAIAQGGATTQVARLMTGIGARGREMGGQVIRLTADITKNAVSFGDRALPFALGVSEFGKAFLGIGNTIPKTLIGVANAGVGFSALYFGSKTLNDYINAQSGNTGANGDGQGEVPLLSPSGQTGVYRDPNKAVTPPAVDIVTSLKSVSEEFDSLIARVRRSANTGFYATGA